MAAVLQLAIIGLAWMLSTGRITTELDPVRWMTVLGVAAVSITVCSGLISLARFALSRDRISLDVGVLMLVVAAGWLVPRTLVPVLGYDWGSAGRAMALGAACTVLALTIVVVVRPAIDQRLSVPRRLATTAIPLILAPTTILLLGFDFDGTVLRYLALPLIGISAAIALTGGILRHRWLVAFVGMQFLGIQIAELFGIEAANEQGQLWLLGVGMISFTAACLGLYGVVVDLRQAFIGDQARMSRSWSELQKARKIALKEREAHQDRMHSLRSGLLGVEAVAWTISGATDPIEVGEIIAIEVSRLRELTERSRLEVTEFNLTDALDDLVVSKLRQGKALTLDTPRSLWIHAARAETVDAVHCLVDNAVRHAPGTPITISAGLSKDAEHMEIRVRDRGPGVPVKMREKIFSRGMTTHAEGTGIGLPVARMIAEAQGGELVYQPRLGGGSEFVMSLPLELAGAERLFV
ncbi:MAG: sensor histidine kinase [Acidimicrobiales bacterium]